ncbi:hypothetical protein AAC387_Pa09g0183 [Persea americana]
MSQGRRYYKNQEIEQATMNKFISITTAFAAPAIGIFGIDRIFANGSNMGFSCFHQNFLGDMTADGLFSP